MQNGLCTLLLTSALAFVVLPATAQRIDRYQRKLEEYRSGEWPPERTYSRISLGYALQKTFKKHCEYCGFATPDGRRDYVPQDISKFLGKRDMRTKVETADIRGGGLLYYLFTSDEILRPFDEVNYSPSRILRLNSVSNQFAIDPDENFDSFILHKNCSGYLKAALDAGVEPPYLAFRTALDTDSRRQSSVIALSGSFLSPLSLVLSANDSRTTEAMMKLWYFYQENPSYVNNAYYLREFEGVMIKHLTSAEENFRIETEGGLNLTAPIPAHLKASFGISKSSNLSFLGNDWETIVFSDFERPYDKQALFTPLPSPSDIHRYLAGIRPVFQNAQDLPLMIEGVEHKHFLIVEGIPENMASNYWLIENVQAGVYDGLPSLTAEPFADKESCTSGCRFTVTGRPLARNFQGPIDGRPSKLNVRYRIRSKAPVNGEYLSFDIDQEIQTSAHPIANITDGQFDLSKKDGWEFAFQWKFAIEIEDRYNPVSFDVLPYIGNLLVRRSDKELNVRIAKVEPDATRKRFYVTLETQEAFPLNRIDNANMVAYNLALDIHLKSQRSGITSVRPLKSILRFPALKENVVEPPVPAAAEAPAAAPATPAIQTGGSGGGSQEE
ncbi:MAG: hypothetical protein KDC66_12640 [Phaeodactylibacter sp.]|nr:hypothetical protein [Phaeodactylibacter sp.]